MENQNSVPTETIFIANKWQVQRAIKYIAIRIERMVVFVSNNKSVFMANELYQFILWTYFLSMRIKDGDGATFYVIREICSQGKSVFDSEFSLTP